MEILLSFLAGVAVAGLMAYFKIKALTTQKQQAELENARLTERSNGHEQFVRSLLHEQNQKFVALQQAAQDTFKQLATVSLKEQKEELASQQKDFMSPLKETLERFTRQIGDLRTETATRQGLLQQSIERTLQLNENLSQEAKHLTEALKSPKKQGTWGEIILEDILTSAGLRKGIEFETQVSFATPDHQRKQPDFIIHLPGQRDLVIDSKMSLTAYMQWQAATDETQKQTYLKEHVQSLEKHIKELSAQNYPALLPHNKLDFTFMFVPIEYAYLLAVQAKPELNELARQHHIAIVTASNLFAVLQVIHHIWQQERADKITEDIFKTAQEMLERAGRFTQRMEEIRLKINQLDKSYTDADKSLRGKQGLVAAAQHLVDLHFKSTHPLPQLLEEENPSYTAKNP